jgi:hypothetical protein
VALPREAERIVDRYLAVADRLLPGQITGFYLVGSAALDSWHVDRSDIDFVAVLETEDLRQLRALHVLGNVVTAARALSKAQFALPGTMNGVFVLRGDLGKPVTQIRPVASHSGSSVKRGEGFDVNPVMWKVLVERGITMRGPVPDTLGLDPEPGRLRAWNLDQLHGHWRHFAETCLSSRPRRKPLIPAHQVALARVLGPPRLHHTVATGEVISKEAAAAYALDVFAARWHPLIQTALAYRIGRPGPMSRGLTCAAGEFMLEVIEDAGNP